MKKITTIIGLVLISSTVFAEGQIADGVYSCDLSKSCESRVAQEENGNLVWSPTNCLGDTMEYIKISTGYISEEGLVELRVVNQNSFLMIGRHSNTKSLCIRKNP